MLGVIRLILERDEGSASGEEDFFSVARTMPLVAVWQAMLDQSLVNMGGECGGWRGVGEGRTFDAEGCYALVDGVESIFWGVVRLICSL